MAGNQGPGGGGTQGREGGVLALPDKVTCVILVTMSFTSSSRAENGLQLAERMVTTQGSPWPLGKQIYLM
jgi:hypothetical protein